MSGGREQREGENGPDRAKAGAGVPTGGGQRPTSNIQHPTSKEKSGRQAAYDLEERLLAYAVRVIRLVDLLPKSRGGDHLGGQLLRSGTSPALNYGEAQAAEFLNDFIHKMKICLKEFRETRRALRIIEAVPLASGKGLEEVRWIAGETEELIRMFFSAIRTLATRPDEQGGGSASSRVREDSSALGDSSTVASSDGELLKETDPITGAQSWMLDVGRWMLDVESGSTGDLARRTTEAPR
jgi:four helix bundle protein